MEATQAFHLIAHALNAGRAAGGYLICGDLQGQCDVLVDALLAHLFPQDAARIAAKSHPDIAVLEPEGKSRTIHIKSMRERIVEPLQVTAFSGGWKVGIIVGADRMELAAANAFLKTLEEPPPQTLLLLLTDNPDVILPTIVSRTQRIDLPLSEGLLSGEPLAAIQTLFATKCDDLAARTRLGSQLAEILGNLKDEAEEETIPQVKKAFFKTILSVMRRWMIEARLPRYLAFRNVEAVEDAYRQSERFLPDEVVLCGMMDKVTFP